MAEDGDLPTVSAHSSRDKAFEIFVKRTITSIQKEAWGRSKEVKEIRETCQAFLNRLEQTGCTEETVREVLKPLELACCSNMQKVVELALGCLHKLVAHAWLHGESTPSGSMDMLSAHGSVDGDDTVAQAIKIVIKCGETTHEGLQLAVVRALLTFTTAEHFVAHGECLLAAVRAVFNLALGSDNQVNKRTACNALLQVSPVTCSVVNEVVCIPACVVATCSAVIKCDTMPAMFTPCSLNNKVDSMLALLLPAVSTIHLYVGLPRILNLFTAAADAQHHRQARHPDAAAPDQQRVLQPHRLGRDGAHAQQLLCQPPPQP
jgi:hypothetical protein